MGSTPLIDPFELVRCGLGRFVRAGRESLCLVRVKGDALALETLFVAEDVYSQAEIAEAVEDTDVKDSELELARQVIASLEGDFDASELHSEYRRDLRALLEPGELRPKVFWRGYDVYDYDNVGFVTQGPGAEAQGWRYDTSAPGNGNQGHEYGTRLTPDEKDALIEYLKTF